MAFPCRLFAVRECKGVGNALGTEPCGASRTSSAFSLSSTGALHWTLGREASLFLGQDEGPDCYSRDIREHNWDKGLEEIANR